MVLFRIAFYLDTGFPNCVGSLDGKHIRIKQPPGSGTQFWNYKKFYSIVLLGVVDSRRRFIHAEAGINGAISDGGVFNFSNLKQKLDANELNLPQDKVFIADSAFPLRHDVMKAFPEARATAQQKIFNRRLTSARFVVEHGFGILANRMRCLRTTLEVGVENAKLITMACVVMHNFFIDNSTTYSALQATDDTFEIPSILSTARNESHQSGQVVRDQFVAWFANNSTN